MITVKWNEGNVMKGESVSGHGVGVVATEEGIWGNIALRGKALRLLEDVGSRGDATELNKILDKYHLTYHEFDSDKDGKDEKDIRHLRNLLGAVQSTTKKIYVNRDMPGNERHFILGYEVAHITLHPNKDRWIFRQEGQEGQELQEKKHIKRETNVFAYELLMPLSKFKRAYTETNGDICALSERFFVPEDKINKRIGFLKKQIADNKIDNFMEAGTKGVSKVPMWCLKTVGRR